jgi:4-amino-4-deoxy-L-arabinose transferase-like glycosyltransferase
VTLGVFLLALFALPVKKEGAFTVSQRGLHQSAMLFVESGPLEFFSQFHSLPGVVPDWDTDRVIDPDPRNMEEKADQVSAFLRGLDWVPFNDAIAADIDRILAQKHGPGSVLLVVPFVFLFGENVAATAIGAFALSAVTPLLGYLLYRRFYDPDVARTVGLLTAFAPALFIYTRIGSPVPYDVFLGLYVAATLVLFVRGVRRDEYLTLAAAGVTVSLGVLTKVTGVFLLPTLVGLAYYYLTLEDADPTGLGVAAGTAAATPLVMLAAGYNFVSQLAFTILKELVVDGSSRSPTGPRGHLADPVVARIIPMYNARWMSIPLVLLAGIFVWWLLRTRRLRDEVDVVALLMLVSLVPYLIYLLTSTGTLARHMVPYLVPLGFVGARGLDHVVSGDRDGVVLLGRLSLAVTLSSLLINI